MNQYKQRTLPALLKTRESLGDRVNIINNMVELTIDGQRVVVPTAEAFDRLLKKVAQLETKLYTSDNRMNRLARQ